MTEPYTIDAWPLCDGCQQPRHTMCLICGTAGCDFRPADHVIVDMVEVHEPETGELEAGIHAEGPAIIERISQLLMCSTCDEPFEPRFARWCEWCGHDFGDGYEVRVRETEPISPRTMAVGIALIAVMVGVMIYFAMIVG